MSLNVSLLSYYLNREDSRRKKLLWHRLCEQEKWTGLYFQGYSSEKLCIEMFKTFLVAFEGKIKENVDRSLFIFFWVNVSYLFCLFCSDS